MKKVLLSLLASAVVATSVNAQDNESAPLTLSGSVDSYYRTALNVSDNGPVSAAPVTSFVGGTGFNIGMINLVASKEGEKSGFVADLAFGPRGNSAIFNSNPFIDGSNHVINQLYAYYNINDMFTFTLGNFNTFLGYEVISPVGNYNYSTSYMFSYGPFSHTGAKLDIAITDELSAMVGVFNPTDMKVLGNNSMMYGAQLGYSNDALGVYLNYLGGNTGSKTATTAQYNQIDLTAGIDVTEELYLGLNATYATQQNEGVYQSIAEDTLADETGFAGIALYAQYAISDNFSLGLRAERTSSRNGFIGIPEFTTDIDKATQMNTNGAVTALTLTGKYTVGDLTLIPELRTDIFNKLDTSDDNPDGMPQFNNAFDNATGGTDYKKAISSFTLGAVYAF